MTASPRFPRLDDWLEWQQSLHPNPIDLGLERVSRVLGRTGWRGPRQPVITVGGTNGKGSCVALLDALLRAGGYRVGTFTSPHLVDYRERIRLDGAQVSEASLVAAFERIADALEGESLTFFEFNTLAALLVFETWARATPCDRGPPRPRWRRRHRRC
jgi:dihydrofolate synthase/folylpolyglutamate synthase